MGRPELSRNGHTAEGHDSAGAVPPGDQAPTRPGADHDDLTVEAADLDAGDEDLPLEDSKVAGGSATVELQLRVGDGFTEDERPEIVRRFAPLDARLRRFAAVDVDMELSIKDRERPGQKVTLECWIARMPRFVATSHIDDFDAALIEVRDDLRRQINDAKTKSEPRHSRRLRSTIPSPGLDDGQPEHL